MRSSVILQHFRQKFRNVHSSINIWICTYIRALIKTISISYSQTCLHMYIQTYVRRECRSSDTDLNSLTVKNNLQNYNWDHKVITFIYMLGILNEVHYSLGLTTFFIVHMYIAFASICVSKSKLFWCNSLVCHFHSSPGPEFKYILMSTSSFAVLFKPIDYRRARCVQGEIDRNRLTYKHTHTHTQWGRVGKRLAHCNLGVVSVTLLWLQQLQWQI